MPGSRKYSSGRLIGSSGRFRRNHIDEAFERLPREVFETVAARLAAGVAIYDAEGRREFQNQAFVDSSIDPPAGVRTHAQHHGAVVDENLEPLTPETCPACVALSTGAPASGMIGTPVFWSFRWRLILAEPRRRGGLVVITVAAGRTFLRRLRPEDDGVVLLVRAVGTLALFSAWASLDPFLSFSDILMHVGRFARLNC